MVCASLYWIPAETIIGPIRPSLSPPRSEDIRAGYFRSAPALRSGRKMHCIYKGPKKYLNGNVKCNDNVTSVVTTQ